MSHATKLIDLLKELRKEIELSETEMLGNERSPAFELQDVEVEAKFTVACPLLGLSPLLVLLFQFHRRSIPVR
jgi:hypothetical protein